MQIENLSFAYGGPDKRRVLEDVSFTVKKGGITTIMGANGCGKSTLLHLMSKNLIPDSGRICLDGEDIQAIRLKQFARQVSIVHQHNTASEDITVRRLVAYGRLPWQNLCQNICGGSSDEDERLIDQALAETGLKEYENRTVSKLSGGQKQRVWIAMALAQNADMMLLDEPTTFLDIRYQIEVLKLVRRLNQEHGMTIVMVLHDINQAIAYSDEIIGLKDGRVLAAGPPGAVISQEVIRELYGVELEVEELRGRKVVLTA